MLLMVVTSAGLGGNGCGFVEDSRYVETVDGVALLGLRDPVNAAENVTESDMVNLLVSIDGTCASFIGGGRTAIGRILL